ncbi:DUF433 domain-containing protein [bacterium]|nr:DUF433 domain-containing protein [bacterium]
MSREIFRFNLQGRLAFFAGKCYYKQETKGVYQVKNAKLSANKHKSPNKKLVREMYGDEVYEYYPLGKYVVAAPGVCGGRPTFKYTRLEVRVILALLATGETIDQVVQAYSESKLSSEAVKEAIQVAKQALLQSVNGDSRNSEPYRLLRI